MGLPCSAKCDSTHVACICFQLKAGQCLLGHPSQVKPLKVAALGSKVRQGVRSRKKELNDELLAYKERAA